MQAKRALTVVHTEMLLRSKVYLLEGLHDHLLITASTVVYSLLQMTRCEIIKYKKMSGEEVLLFTAARLPHRCQCLSA